LPGNLHRADAPARQWPWAQQARGLLWSRRVVAVAGQRFVAFVARLTGALRGFFSAAFSAFSAASISGRAARTVAQASSAAGPPQ